MASQCRGRFLAGGRSAKARIPGTHADRSLAPSDDSGLVSFTPGVERIPATLQISGKSLCCFISRHVPFGRLHVPYSFFCSITAISSGLGPIFDFIFF